MGELAAQNAEVLARALRAGLRELDSIVADDERRRRAAALAHIEGYMQLLGLPTSQVMEGEPVRYSFKLVFPDGRWSVDEKQLEDPPREGDVVDFDGYGGWRVQGRQQVGVRPSGKPPRAFFVCAPAA